MSLASLYPLEPERLKTSRRGVSHPESGFDRWRNGAPLPIQERTFSKSSIEAVQRRGAEHRQHFIQTLLNFGGRYSTTASQPQRGPPIRFEDRFWGVRPRRHWLLLD